jgi:hypothetical protein
MRVDILNVLAISTLYNFSSYMKNLYIMIIKL